MNDQAIADQVGSFTSNSGSGQQQDGTEYGDNGAGFHSTSPLNDRQHGSCLCSLIPQSDSLETEPA